MTTAGIGYEVDAESRRAVVNALEELAKRGADATAANQRVLGVGLAEAQRTAPNRSGELIGTLSIDATPDGGQVTVGVAYAPYQEFGTRYVRAKRFMAAAHDAMTDSAEPAYTDHLEAAIRSAGG